MQRGPRARFAGVRTFTTIGALGGLSGGLSSAGLSGPAAAIVAGTAGVTVVAYLAASGREIDATTNPLDDNGGLSWQPQWPRSEVEQFRCHADHSIHAQRLGLDDHWCGIFGAGAAKFRSRALVWAKGRRKP